MELTKMKNQKKVKAGKKSRAAGAAFELRVRKDLEERGWIVDKWRNNVELKPEYTCCGNAENWKIDYGRRCQSSDGEELSTFETVCDVCGEDVSGDSNDAYQEVDVVGYNGRLIQAKNKWAGPDRPMMMGAGFPDFICFRVVYDTECDITYEVVGVESKINGELDKIEKEKCLWLLKNNIFSKILIAEKTKVKNKIVIVYHDFKEKYGKNKKLKKKI